MFQGQHLVPAMLTLALACAACAIACGFWVWACGDAFRRDDRPKTVFGVAATVFGVVGVGLGIWAWTISDHHWGDTCRAMGGKDYGSHGCFRPGSRVDVP